MFSIGFPELMIIMVVGLIVLGPEKLPEVARMIARAMRDIRKYADDVRSEFEKNVLTEDLREIKNDLQSLTEEASDYDAYDHGSDISAEEDAYPYENAEFPEDYLGKLEATEGETEEEEGTAACDENERSSADDQPAD